MVEYKDASFFTKYFNSQKDFKVIDEFKISEDKEEKNLYIGSVEVLGTIHPLILRVEIPFTFPHNKLVFRTKSLSGYPHLIHTGKVKFGDWFCLNTPFAETVEEQLNQEIVRLKEWILHQMREDLPSVIKDVNVKHSLAFANAYEWENLDEVKEFSSQAMLTFVGDFHCNKDYFKESLGFLSCIKSPDNRFYAIADPALANHKLPYIIVDEAPKSVATLEDFFQLKEQYGWDDKTCEHLLPDFNIVDGWTRCEFQSLGTHEFEESKALDIISGLEKELEKKESYILANKTKTNRLLTDDSDKRPTIVLPNQKVTILQELESLKQIIKKNHKYDPWKGFGDFENMTEDEIAKQDYDYYLYEVSLYEWHHFAFGIKSNDSIGWYILFTHRAAGHYDKITFDLTIKDIELQKLISYPLKRLGTQVITEDMYFGRGAFSSNFKSKKIALVGLGAIGSMVATSLAHTGVSKIGLWDFDIVEPGNICRSAYTLTNIGESKVYSIASIIKSINPFVKADDICKNGYWVSNNVNDSEFVGTSFYANVNYNSQEESIKELEGYDLIIDCTGSNEMLHFLSYAAANVDIISMCITNHADDLLCITNKDGNPFELRKAYLSRIEQDTKNFYIEGSGCYSPTFLANNCDIASLVNLALRDINKCMEEGKLMHSSIYSYSDRGIVSDRLATYKLEDYDIYLTVSSETLYDAEEMEDAPNGDIGYLLGSYSRDGKQIMITHIVDSLNAKELLSDAFETSKGLIDYIGDYRYSGESAESYNATSFEIIATKAEDASINTNNPLLAARNPDGSVSFFLYINNELVKFIKES